VLGERAHYSLRKLHSLTGVVPIGVFLLEHFFTNSFAVFGPEAFNEKVEFLTSLPYLLVIETALIFLPIAFHAGLGVVIALTARHNLRTMNYGRNWAFLFQRLTGLFLVAFIVVHLAKTRFSGTPADAMFQHMAGYLPNPLWFAFYALGVAAASYHFANGLATFAIAWGITTGRRAQRVWSAACLVLAIGLTAVGVRSLVAFAVSDEARARQQFLEHAPHPEPVGGAR
jgi:succinate dehydrogenase / fumarate reductase cytochrome b subunit